MDNTPDKRPVYEDGQTNTRKTRINIKGICTNTTECQSLPKDYVVMDFETTGLKEDSSKIIQVAVYRYRDYIKTDELVTYVDPQEHIPEEITELTGISDEDVEGAPAIEIILPRLLSFIKGEIVVGHNIPFDLRFLAYNAQENGIKLLPIKYIDTLQLSRRYICGVDNYKLKTLKEYLGIVAASHSADEDCYVCGEVYRRCAATAGLKAMEINSGTNYNG